MKVLVACEESQAVTIAFRARGHEAYSCDIIDCSGGHPEWHIKQDVIPLLGGNCTITTQDGINHEIDKKWDLIIAHPPCTFLSNAGAVRMRVNGGIVNERYKKAMEARSFFMNFYNADCSKVAIENPTPMHLVKLPEYDQSIQPWQFGHPYSKRTCLWLKGLPPLIPTKVISNGITPYVSGGSKDRRGNRRRMQGCVRDPKIRSKTFPGIAKAMAAQWGKEVEECDA